MPEITSQFWLWMIPGGPLLAAIVVTLLGVSLRGASHWPCWIGLACSALGAIVTCLSSVPAAVADGSGVVVAPGYEWLSVGDLQIGMNLRADALSAQMLVMVTCVSLLVAVFSRGYMHGDRGYPRYFATFSLFVFSMVGLVLSGNFAQLFIFWELVGLCSYLLIGFWYQRPSASAAAKKAFVVNRVGDFGLLLGIFLIWTTFVSLDFATVFGDTKALAQTAAASPGTITTICLLLLLGAMGKSAQFPLHVWLPDAMEGPTPVSALIHAATMVTAGVYLVARSLPLFVHSTEAQIAVTAIGGITALVAALIALSQFDLKRVLAYSTVSQLGYMFMALGVAAADEHLAAAGATAAMFHLVTHGVFKALLFLSAGSVMHAMGDVIDMRRFGGLRRVLPITHWTFLIGAAALAGLPPLAGFWSKDEILAVLATASSTEGASPVFTIVFWTAIVTAVLTAFYTFRAYFMTFGGELRLPEQAGHHPHDASPVMAWPLRILAGGAVVVGVVLGPTHLFAKYVAATPHIGQAHAHSVNYGVIALSVIAAVGGALAARYAYSGTTPQLPPAVGWLASPLIGFSRDKFYIDEILMTLVVLPLRTVGKISRLLDRHVLDPLVDGIGYLPRMVASVAAWLQAGFISNYALLALTGLLGCLILVLILA